MSTAANDKRTIELSVVELVALDIALRDRTEQLRAMHGRNANYYTLRAIARKIQSALGVESNV